LSIRLIAEQLGVDKMVVQRDCDWAAKHLGVHSSNHIDAVRTQLLGIMREVAANALLEIDQQRKHGQVIEQLDAEGNVIGMQRRRGVDPRVLNEATKSATAIARLMGLTEGGGGEGGGGAISLVQIALPGPADGPTFQEHAKALSGASEPPAAAPAAPQGAEVVVDAEVVPEPPGAPLEAAEGA
jgi:hypothetical protein